MREQSNSKWRRPLYPLRKPVFCGGAAVVEGAMVKRRWLSPPTSSASASSVCTQFTGEHDHQGLGKLKRDVKSCSYHDVHVMWQLIHNLPSSQHPPKSSHNGQEYNFNNQGLHLCMA